MTALRQQSADYTVRYTFGQISGSTSVAKRPLPPEAFAYEGDVTEEDVRAIQEQADKDLAGEEWELVDGYDGRK